MTEALSQGWESALRHLRPLIDANLPLALGVVALWAVIGLAVGVVLALGTFAWMRRAAAPSVALWHAGCLRVGVAAWLVVSLGTLGLIAGANEGLVPAGRRILEQPSVRSGYLEPLGEVGADALCLLDAALNAAERGTDLRAASVSVGRGCEDGALDVPGLQARIGRVERHSVEAAVGLVKERVGLGRGTKVRELADDLLDRLLKAVVRLSLGPGARTVFGEVGLRDVRDMLERLPEAAAAHGTSGRLDRGALSTHIVRHAVIPATLRPVRAFVRANQIGAALLALAAVAASFALLWLLRRLEARGAPKGRLI